MNLAKIAGGLAVAMLALHATTSSAETPPKIMQFSEKTPITLSSSQAYLMFRAHRILGFRFLHVPDVPGMTATKAASDRANWVDVAGWVHVEKGGPIDTFLVPVKPGAYYLYGEKVDFYIGGVEHALMCLCMGTLRFSARAGTITDLGEIRQLHTETGNGKRPDSRGRMLNFKGNREVRATAVELPGEQDYVPARLADLPRERVTYRAGGFLPNISGVAIDRISSIPGVIRYERDRVIDVATGQEADGM